MSDLAQKAITRLTAFPLAWLAVAFTLAQLAGLVSALVVARELNPLPAPIGGGPPRARALKLGLVALVVAVAEICDRRRPLLARAVLVIGTIAGLLGAMSNTHLTPFLSA